MNSEIYTLENSNEQDYQNLQKKLSSVILSEKHIKILKTKSWWTTNHDVLQSELEKICPGTHLVAVPWDSKTLKYLSKGGILRINDRKDILFHEMEASSCHNNCEILLSAGKIESYCTGYALSIDRLWRHHSWGISFDNKIVETTEPRIAYLTNENYK